MILPPKVIHPTGEPEFTPKKTEISALIADTFNGQLPADLNFLPVANDNSAATFHSLETEADEMWSFFGNKNNKQWIWIWIWIALDVNTRQAIAFHVGKRDWDAAWALWHKILSNISNKLIFIPIFMSLMWVSFLKTNTIPSPKTAV